MLEGEYLLQRKTTGSISHGQYVYLILYQSNAQLTFKPNRDNYNYVMYLGE